MTAPRARVHSGAVAALVFAAVAVFAACAVHPETCGLCQREIHREVRTIVTFEDGRHVAACCPRCALRVAQESAARARAIEVTDYQGGGMLPITDAWLVDGSDETPCLRHHPPVTAGEGAPMHACYDRCMPSLIAFRDEAAARAFVEDHGGNLEPPGPVASHLPGHP